MSWSLIFLYLQVAHCNLLDQFLYQKLLQKVRFVQELSLTSLLAPYPQHYLLRRFFCCKIEDVILIQSLQKVMVKCICRSLTKAQINVLFHPHSYLNCRGKYFTLILQDHCTTLALWHGQGATSPWRVEESRHPPTST